MYFTYRRTEKIDVKKFDFLANEKTPEEIKLKLRMFQQNLLLRDVMEQSKKECNMHCF